MTIARARLAPDVQTPLNKWSIEQLIETYYLACRELWREVDLQIRIAGGKGGKEPDFRPRAKRQSSGDFVSRIRNFGKDF